MLAGTDLAIGPVVDTKMQHGGLDGFDVGFVSRTLVFGKDTQQGELSFCLQILLFLRLDGDTNVDLPFRGFAGFDAVDFCVDDLQG